MANGLPFGMEFDILLCWGGLSAVAAFKAGVLIGTWEYKAQ